MQQVNVKRLHEDNREALALAWIAGRDAVTVVRREPAASAALIGHLNLTHPNRIQVVGADEAAALEAMADQLLAAAPAAVILADGIAAPETLRARAEQSRTPLFTTPLPATRVIERIARYLAKALAERTERHGVFMDVLGMGVLDHRGFGRRQERARAGTDQPRPRPGGRRRGGDLAPRGRHARGALPGDAQGLHRGARTRPARRAHHLRRDRGAARR